jgi:hypothetical protein
MVALAPNVIVEEVLARFAAMIGLDVAERRAFERRLGANAGMDVATVQLDALVGAMTGELLVVHDRGDREVSFTQAERLVAAWPGAELVATDGLGHRRILRDADVIRRCVDFATAHVAPPVSDLAREVDRLCDQP